MPGGAAPPVAARAAAPAAPVPAAAPGVPPPSLRGTGVDGELVLGPDGRFVPTPSALDLFRYFLSASGEEPPEALRARIVAEIRARLPDAEAAAAAIALLDDYLAYREAVRDEFDARLAESADLERRVQWLRELRREVFGAEVAALLFAEEEAAILVALERRRVLTDPTLSDDERAARIEGLEEALPDSMREARRRAAAPLALLRDEAALREAGASDSELWALREERFGGEAVERLAALDSRRAQWEARLAEYRAERDALVADASLGPAARAAALDALRAAHFEPAELPRVRALDRIEAAAQGSGASGSSDSSASSRSLR